MGLKETLAALRQGHGIPMGKKVLIVLDQFEQWLHAKKDEENTELVQALRQCDGERVQCLVLVRDDFWMAMTRFLRELEIRLLEGQNSGAVDLSPLRHAEKVLAAFGRAFGVLPEKASATSKEQQEFLTRAVSGLAQENKVICVRLALFADMMKGRPWTPASLKEVGGAEGVGVTFLEETFSSATAAPEHRYHQKAARAVLHALLPESGTDIKGSMRSYAELLEASGYGNRPKDFDDLLRILDSEIRLITPTDPEGVEGGGWREKKTMTLQSYRQLEVWHLTMELAEKCYRATKGFPKEELFGLTSQIRRASGSIPANLAEGQGREHTKEFLNHVSIARGSLMELETHLLLSHRVGLLEQTELENLLALSDRISRMLTGLRKALLQKFQA